jgi:hypothetical protein
MKSAILNLLILLAVIQLAKPAQAQQLPEILQQVLKADTSFNTLRCRINIHIDVAGLKIPDKVIALELEKGKEPKIKSEGMIIFPKRGILGQYHEFLETKCQSILITEKPDTLVYKLVSLDNTTDWVTVDLKVSKRDAKVHEMLLSTRKKGEFIVKHKYNRGSFVFPERTEISFEAMPVKFPLKFMGQKSSEPSILNSDEPVNGKVILLYSSIVVN